MKPLTNIKEYLDGSRKLPAGAVPMAESDRGWHAVCLMPDGQWLSWRDLDKMAPEHLFEENQGPDVLNVIIEHLGLTTDSLAGLLGVSYYTVKGWRAGNPIPIGRAYEIMKIQAKMEDERDGKQI